jgi:predicted ribosome quality control (RQC) complex YloA/Tae2 family protein
MLQARNPKLTLAGGFLNKCKALFAKVKEFFGAESWRDQLVAANDRLSQVLGDFEKAIVAENLMISINIQAVVEGLAERISDDHKAVLDVKGALQQQHELLLQGSKGISRIEAVQQQLLQQEQQLHNQVLRQLQQLPQYKDVQRIETLQKQLLQQQQQHHEQLLKRLQQLEQQQEHADGSKIQEMMQELHAMMQQQQQHQEHATSAQGRSDVSELKGMMQELQLKLQMRSMARGPAAPAAAPKELRGMRTFTSSDITIIELIGDGGNSDVYLAQCRFFPGHIVYKKC